MLKIPIDKPKPDFNFFSKVPKKDIRIVISISSYMIPTIYNLILFDGGQYEQV